MVTGNHNNPPTAEISRLPLRAPVPPRQARCYVRVTNADRRGFIEFQFSIGDPALFLEMTLPPAAFAEFCAEHRVQHLNAAQAAEVDAGEARWRYGSDVPE